jgi:hypothetical protein
VSHDDDTRRATDITAMVAELQPDAFHAKSKQYQRGGLPSSSMPEAISRTSEPPLPSFDKQDRIVRERVREYGRKLRNIDEDLRSLLAIQGNMLIPVDPFQEVVVLCANHPKCENELKADYKHKECERCKKHRYKNKQDGYLTKDGRGMPFPWKLGDDEPCADENAEEVA